MYYSYVYKSVGGLAHWELSPLKCKIDNSRGLKVPLTKIQTQTRRRQVFIRRILWARLNISQQPILSIWHHRSTPEYKFSAKEYVLQKTAEKHLGQFNTCYWNRLKINAWTALFVTTFKDHLISKVINTSATTKPSSLRLNHVVIKSVLITA